MLLSVLKRFLHPRKPTTESSAQRSSAEISESRVASDMNEESVYQGVEMPEAESVDFNPAEQPSTTSVLIDEDLEALKTNFDELGDIESITQLPNPTRYAALRDLGLSPDEAYLATRRVTKPNTKSHLTSSVPRAASSPYGAMTRQQLAEAREIFGNLSDTEIQRLYKRVNNY